MLVDGSSKPAVSVVIPAFKSKETIPFCLNRLLAQDTELPYEIIVVESSGDGAADLVREEFPAVKVVESKQRLYSGQARNAGAEIASGEILAFIDSDCLTEDSWITKMWEAHKREKCSAVGGAILNGNPHLCISISSYLNEFSDFYASGKLRPSRYLSTCNISYKTDVFRKYGGFDPKETLYVDLMFNTRLSRSGETLLFAPEIKAWHLHRTTLREYFGHEYRRGKAAAVARKKGLLAGSMLADHPALAAIGLPALFLRKAAVFPYRFIKAYPSDMPALARSLPCFYLALLVWHYGFIQEVTRLHRAGTSEEGAAGCTNN